MQLRGLKALYSRRLQCKACRTFRLTTLCIATFFLQMKLLISVRLCWFKLVLFQQTYQCLWKHPSWETPSTEVLGWTKETPIYSKCVSKKLATKGDVRTYTNHIIIPSCVHPCRRCHFGKFLGPFLLIEIVFGCFWSWNPQNGLMPRIFPLDSMNTKVVMMLWWWGKRCCFLTTDNHWHVSLWCFAVLGPTSFKGPRKSVQWPCLASRGLWFLEWMKMKPWRSCHEKQATNRVHGGGWVHSNLRMHIYDINYIWCRCISY